VSEFPAGLEAVRQSRLVREALSGSRPWLMALDYDGTLAPFRPERDLAVPYPELGPVLHKLPVTGSNRFLIISGRECDSVKRLLGVTPHPEIWGCHGLQRLLPGGGMELTSLRPHQARALQFAVESMDEPDRVERKPCSVAIHWRGLDSKAREEMEARCRPLLAELADSSGMELHAFDGGLELRPPGPGKGGAIEVLSRENPDAALFFLGDDATDEDGFAALGRNGLGILIKDEPRPTKASFRLSAPGELLDFLTLFTP